MSLSREPAVWINLVKVVLQLLAVFGVALTQDQRDAIVSVVTALIAVGGIEAVGTLLVRSRVLPVNAAVPGTPVVLEDGTAGRVEAA